MLFLGHCFPRLRERVNAWWVHGGACCTHGYIISWHGALRVLAAIDPLAAPIDEVLRDLCFSGQIGCYLLLPDTSQYGGEQEAAEVVTEVPELPFGLFVQDWQEAQRAQHEADMREKRSFRDTPPA
jgi:hypothetical protein